MTPGQTNVVETKLVLTVDGSRGVSGARAVTQELNGVNRAAQEAQKNLSRMSMSQRAAQGSDGFYRFEGDTPYGVQGPSGMSKAQASRRSYPGATSGPPMPGQWQTGGTSRGGGAGGGELDPKVMNGVVIAFTAIIDAADKLAHAMDRAAVTSSPGGARLSRSQQRWMSGIEGIGEVPLAGRFFRAGGNLAEVSAFDSVAGQRMVRAIGGDPNVRRDARERAYQSQVDLASVDANYAFDSKQGDMRRQAAALGLDAGMSREIANQARARAPGYQRAYLDDPSLAAALAGQDAANVRRQYAARAVGSAEGEYAMAGDRVRGEQQRLALVKGNVDPWNTAFGSLSPTAGFRNTAEKSEVMAAELRLANALKDQEAALNRLKEAGVNLTRQDAEARKASLDVQRAQLTVLEKGQGQATSYAGTSQWDRSNIIMVAKKAKANPRSLTPEEWQLLSSNPVTAQYAAKLAAKVFFDDPGFNELRGVTGQSDLTGRFNEIEKLQLSIQTQFVLDEAAYKQQLSDSFGKFMEDLKKIQREELQNQIRIVKEQVGQSRDQQKAGG